MLAHALKTEINAETADVLRRHAATLPERDDATPPLTEEG
jgi:hypothetical protein